jgi:hypothetical protein
MVLVITIWQVKNSEDIQVNSEIAGKSLFGTVERRKTKDFEDGNSALAWEILRKKYDFLAHHW